MLKTQNNLLIKLAFAITALIFAAVLGSHLTDELWNDEIYSLVHFVFVPISQTLTDYHSTNNHIFYNLINSGIFRLLGIGSLDILLLFPVIIRSISLIYCIITCYFVYKTAKLLFNGKVALLSLAILFTTVAFTNQALQARGYSLSLLFCSILFYYNILQIKKSSLKNLLVLFVFSVLLSYTMLSNLWFVLAIFCVSILQKQWKLAILYSLAILTTIILYSPMIGSFADNETLKSLKFFPFEIFWKFMPKIFYYFLDFRYLFVIIIPIAIYKLFSSHKKQILLLFTFLILPFLFSLLKMQIPPDRVLLFFIPVFAVFAAFGVQHVLSLAGKRETLFMILFLMYLNISNIYSFIEIKKTMTANIELGIRKQNLMFNYYQTKYNPCEIADFCKDKSAVVLFDTEPHDMVYYLKMNNIKPKTSRNLDSLLSINKTIWCVARFPNQAKTSLQKLLPNANIEQVPLPIGYYAVFRCALR